MHRGWWEGGSRGCHVDSGADEGSADEEDCEAGDVGWEHRPEGLGGDERHAGLDKGSDHKHAQHVAIGLRKVDTLPGLCGDSPLDDREEGEAGAHDGQQAAAELVVGLRDLEARDLNHRGEAADDEGEGDQGRLVALVRGRVSKANEERGRDDASDHAQGVLEPHEDGQHHGQELVGSVEWQMSDHVLAPGIENVTGCSK